MHHSLFNMDVPKGKKPRDFYEKYICQNMWLFLRKTRKGRETPPVSVYLRKTPAPGSQDGPQPVWKRNPAVRHGSASLPNTLRTFSDTELHHHSFHAVSAEEHAHLHPQNNREINGDDCNSYSLVSAAVKRSNKLRLWILGRDFKLAL